MVNNNVSVEDVTATVQANAEEVVDSARTKLEDAKDAVQNLSVNQKMVVTGVAAIVVSVLVQKLVTRVRSGKVEEVIIVSEEVVSED